MKTGSISSTFSKALAAAASTGGFYATTGFISAGAAATGTAAGAGGAGGAGVAASVAAVVVSA